MLQSNAEFTDEQLIAECIKLEDHIKAAAKKFDEWAKPHKERISQIEGMLFARLNERGADSTKTDSGTAYISTLMNTKVEDQEKLFDYIADHWDELKGDVMLNISKAAVKNHMEEHGGHVPPGMSISHFQRLNVRRT